MTIVRLVVFVFQLKGLLSRFHKSLLPVLLSLFILAPAMADEITLNMKDADIRILIQQVSKFTGKNFIIDPRVKAKVTVISSNTLSTNEVYEVFLSVLQVHGYAAVPTGAVIKIVPQVNAKQGPLPLSGPKSNFAADELVTKIIRLDHVPAAQLVPILRPLVPQQGHLAAYNPTNTLIITDHAGNIKRLMKIIQGVDRPDSDELEIIPLKHASASEIVRILNSLNAGGSTKDVTKKIKLAADDRTNSILVTGDRASRLKIRATITYLDTPLEDGSGNTHVIYLKYAKAENLVKILTGLKTQGGSSGATRGKAASANVATGNVISQNTIIQADNETNALIISADPNTIKNLKSVIRQLDIRRAQVLIEAIIAEITTSNNKEIGVGIAVDGGSRDNGALPVGLSNFAGVGDLLLATLGNATSTALSVPAGLSFGLGDTTSSGVRYGALLRALQTDTNTNILSTPNIVTLDNEEAELIVGQNLPFVTGSFTGTGSTDPNNPFQTIERQDVGLTLKVTPQINEGDTVKLDLEQETSSVIPGTLEQGIATRKRSIKTTVLVDDGGILILGGLIQEEVSDTESKVPLLGDIPLIGFLFRTQSTTKSKANLMVFLRPTILRDHKDAAFVTNEKYNYLRGIESGAYNKSDGSFGLLDDAAPRLPPIEELDRSKQTTEKSQVILDSDDDWDDDDDGFI
ncbi:MAG: type II secretion system secretin GspD [Gammaproteobacteria bacterium]|nr:type II secretion system secretin GspD [Gammaproteobacteria bacterium]